MNERKKRILLIAHLVCLVLCAALLLSGCRGSGGNPTEPSVSVEETTTEPEETTTEPEETTTEPEETTTEPEPEETTEESTGNSGNSGINNGTGGSYTPQQPTEAPTEPEESATEPVIEVPSAGSQENPYFEYIAASGSFTTVKIPANGTMHYTIKTAGAFLKIQSEQAAVVYEGKTYEPKDGVLELALPGGGEPVKTALQIVNNGTEEQSFEVIIPEPLGAKSNPIAADDISSIQVKLEQDDTDGVYYVWTADQSGYLNIGLSSVKPEKAGVDVIVTVGNLTVKLSESAKNLIQIPVSHKDAVLVQIVAMRNADGSYPALHAVISGTVLPIKELTVNAIPNTVKTEVIPAGETAYYNVSGVSNTILTVLNQDLTVYYGGSAYGADENGVVTVPLGAENPVKLELVNGSAADTAYSLNFRYPAGHAQNPYTLTVNTIPSTVKTEQIRAGETAFCNISGVSNTVLTIADKHVTVSYGGSTYSADENGVVTVPLGAENPVKLELVNGSAADTAYSLNFRYPAGHAQNPYTLTVNTIPSTVKTEQIRAGETVFCNISGVSNTVLTIADKHVTVTYGGSTYSADENGVVTVQLGTESPVKLALVNGSDADAVYSLNIQYPVGHKRNPDNLFLGTGSVISAEGSSGYWFAYTAPTAGILQLTVTSETNWCYAINGGQIYTSNGEPVVNEGEAVLESGESVLIWFNTYDPENPEIAPAGEVRFTTRFVSDPVELDLTKEYETRIPAGAMAQYTGNLRDITVTISDAYYLRVFYNGNEIAADDMGEVKITFTEPDSNGQWIFGIYNDMPFEQPCSMSFSGEVGSWLNPAELTLGTHQVQQAANGAEYCFHYTAPKAGTLRLTFDPAENWCYSVNGSQMQYSDGEPAVNATEIQVAKGDRVALRVNTYDPDAPDTVPEGTVSFAATLITDTAAIEDPRLGHTAVVIAGETASFTGPFEDATVTISNAAGSYAVCNGTTYEADEEGVIAVDFQQPDSDGQWKFSLHNGSGETASYTMTFTGPVGSWLNFAELALRTNTVIFEENAKDYYFTYLAPKTGKLVLTFDAAENWYYILNDGEKQFSGSDPASNVLSIDVIEDQSIKLQVNTYDPENPETTPAGTVRIAATLVTGPVTIENPAQPTVINLLAGETVIIEGEFGGEKLSIANAADLVLTRQDTACTAGEDGVLSLTFSEGEQSFTLYNGGEEDTTATLIFGEEKGTADNPAELVNGTNIAVCEAGSEGYYFTYKNNTDATVKLTIDFSNVEVDWWWDYEKTDKDGNKIGSGTYYKGKSGAATVNRSVGGYQTITIIVKICDPDTPENGQEGTVEFQVTIP